MTLTKNYMQIKRIASFVLLFLQLSLACFSQTSCVKAGIYDEFVYLGYDGVSKSISGYIDYSPYEADKNSIQISCRIFFEGRVYSCDSNIIRIYKIGDLNSSYNGAISFFKDGLKLYLPDEMASCFNIMPFHKIKHSDSWVSTFYLSEVKHFKSFRVIKNKTKVFSRPDQKSISHKYLIQSDIVEVLKTNSEWALVQYYSSKNTRGWIKTDNLL